MFLPAERISTASIANIGPNHLVIAVDRRGELIWVVGVGDDAFAMFLLGEYAGRGFQITPGAVGSGMAIGPLQVRIDPTSSTADGKQWRLKAIDGALAVQFQADTEGAFSELKWARVAETNTLPDTAVYFSRWSLGIECDHEWVELVSFADGEVKTSFAPVAS